MKEYAEEIALLAFAVVVVFFIFGILNLKFLFPFIIFMILAYFHHLYSIKYTFLEKFKYNPIFSALSQKSGVMAVKFWALMD